MNTGGTHFKRSVPLTQYKREKIDMLENEFMIRLKHPEWARLMTGADEGEVDRAAHDIIMNRL